MRHAAAWALLTACLAFSAPRTALGTPLCSSLTPGLDGRCPASCVSNNRNIPLQNCQTCALTDSYQSASVQAQLYCQKCRPGFRLIQLDTLQNECVIPDRLLCQAFDPEAPGSAYSTSGPCATCQPDTVPVFATNGGNFEFAEQSFSVKRVCRRCQQLGCPGQCKPLAGCVSCPTGSVLLQTRGPAQARTWVGKADYYNVGKKEPALPAVCLKESDLGCPGKARNGKGCIKCPTGKQLGSIPSFGISSSQFIRFYPRGHACN